MTFPCPQPENYAAVAKQLHDTALRAESAIYEKEQLLRSAVNRPTLINTSTDTQTDIPANSDNVLNPVTVVTFANFPLLSSNDSVHSDADTYRVTGEGIYEVGVSGNLVASGAITPASHRTFKVHLLRPDPSALLNPTVFTAGYTIYEPNWAAGVDFSFNAVMRIQPFDTVQFVINHGNASPLILSVGAIFWMQKVSDVDITRVVL